MELFCANEGENLINIINYLMLDAVISLVWLCSSHNMSNRSLINSSNSTHSSSNVRELTPGGDGSPQTGGFKETVVGHWKKNNLESAHHFWLFMCHSPSSTLLIYGLLFYFPLLYI